MVGGNSAGEPRALVQQVEGNGVRGEGENGAGQGGAAAAVARGMVGHVVAITSEEANAPRDRQPWPASSDPSKTLFGNTCERRRGLTGYKRGNRLARKRRIFRGPQC